MNLDEALAFCDRELEAKTATGLSELEKTIFRESWDGATYQAISDSQHLDVGHVKNVGSALFKRISRNLQKVTKKSFRAVFEQMPVSTDSSGQTEISTAAVPPFRVQLRSWLECLGKYTFEEYEASHKSFVEWVIREPRKRRGFDRIVVRGVDGKVELADLQALVASVETQQADEGWLVSARLISPAVRKLAEEDAKYKDQFFCFSLDELIDEEADFTPYIEWLQKEVGRKEIAELYVPIATTKKEFDPATKRLLGMATYDESEGWTEGYINRWLDEESKQHVSILGEFGAGKTWLVLHYAWTLLQEYLEKKTAGRERPRLPLVIQLRNYSKALDLKNVLAGFFFSQHNIRLTAEIFEQLNRMGKLLLIFDGFDEMADRVDRQKMIDNFWELARVVVPGAKAILTCRTEHFPDAQEGRKLLNAELQSSLSNVSGEPPTHLRCCI
ncbi:MAG: NACHT domain-containing protein [Cyanobacteria bacterium P01_H01_bin.15]